MEEMVPIYIDTVKVNTKLGEVIRSNVQYFNIVVKNCPTYIPNPDIPDGFIRSSPITRYNISADVNRTWLWPEHPRDLRGDHTGAIIIIKSLDNKLLLLRNGHLWGLPKGVRNYTEFHLIKETCNTEYFNTGVMPKIDRCVTFKEDDVESPLDNIYRETLEETGIVLDKNKIVQVGPSDMAYTRFLYKLNFNASDHYKHIVQNGTDHENDEMKWITPEELQSMLLKHCSSRRTKVFNHVTYLFLGMGNLGSP